MASPVPSALPRRAATAFLAVAVGALAVGCGGGSGSSTTPAANRQDKATVLRLGYFLNLTHATALVGVEKGIFARALGPGVKLETKPFNAGPAAVEALFSGALDAAYIGPNPAINAYVKSAGKAIKIISGATSGGAFLVVKPGIRDAAELRGKKLATPQLGNTQDVALRSWLAENGLKTTKEGGGDVTVLPQENSQTLETFRAGQVDGAWVPEPWATRLVREGGGTVLVNEADLWPGGRFVTTHLVVRTGYLRANPGIVERLLAGQVEANDVVNADAAQAQRLVNQGIEKVTGKGLSPAVLAAAWKHLTFTDDPIASSLRASAADAQALGFLPKSANLDGIYDLGPLNTVLARKGEAAVSP